MPKIKFSALVSGMSGKANGSVFASNNGGAYFRTNASKIKPQTASNAIRKSKFTGVSQSWRSLTSDQQNAWNDSVASFVVQNAFGDNRTPTGYEVFTRLNNTRATINLPLLVNPPVPRTLPVIGEAELSFPDLYQFMPNFALANFNRVNPSQQTSYFNSDLYSDGPVMNGSLFLAMFSIAGVTQPQSALDSERVLWKVDCQADSLFEVVFVPTLNGFGNIRVSGANGANTWSVTTTDNLIEITEPFSLGVTMPTAGPDEMKIIVNGKTATVNVNQSGVFASPLGNLGLEIAPSELGQDHRCLISDARFFNIIPDETGLRNSGKGYVLGTEKGWWPFDKITTSGQIANVTGVFMQPFVCKPGTESYSLVSPFSSGRVPIMILAVSNEGLEGCQINIYATGPESFGKTGKLTNFRLIASKEWVEETEFDVTEDWKKRFKIFSPGAYVNFYLMVFDTTTGIIPAVKSKVPKRKRFKAGAESGTAVN